MYKRTYLAFSTFIQHDCIFQCLRTILCIAPHLSNRIPPALLPCLRSGSYSPSLFLFPRKYRLFLHPFLFEIDINPVRGVRYRASPILSFDLLFAVKRFRRDQTIIFCRICCCRFSEPRFLPGLAVFPELSLLYHGSQIPPNRNAVKAPVFNDSTVSFTYR